MGSSREMNPEEKERYEKLREKLRECARSVEFCNQKGLSSEADEARRRLDIVFGEMMEIDHKLALVDFNNAFKLARAIMKIENKTNKGTKGGSNPFPRGYRGI